MSRRPRPAATARAATDGKNLRVGVTLFIRDAQQSLWENGIFQNCFFLLTLLQKSPIVGRCCIVNGGPGDPGRASGLLEGNAFDVIGMSDALDALDVVIELSAQLDPAWGREFVARGGRIVAMHVANDFVIDAERMAYGLDPGSLMSGVPYHQVWTLPAFERTCAAYYRAGYRAPVRVMQHLWSPVLLERAVAAYGDGRRFGYVRGRSRWRIAVLEPNICSVKTCHLPLLATDSAHRMAPTAIELLRVFCTDRIRENPVFIAFAYATDLVRHGLATFEGRYPIADIMGPMADAIVSHHWENAQNYLYYEALHGGFPLIHNSGLLDDCGYRYADFDPEDGGRALIQALRQHDRNLESYKADARRLLDRLDPTASANIAAYSGAIAELFSGDTSYRGIAPATATAGIA